MHFEATNELLEVLKPYLINADVSVDSSNADFDLVSIDKKHDVEISVYENEIIVFYFTDHSHFEDYSSALEDGNKDYLERAKEFLLNLFQHKLRCIKYYKGKTLTTEKYFIIYDDRDDEFIGGILHSLLALINPFAKKSSISSTWHFDVSKGHFTTRDPKQFSPDAVEVIDINEDCYIEIFKKGNVFTYDIYVIDYEEYFGRYYWRPGLCSSPGLYDTKENAIKHAKEALRTVR